MGKNVMTSVWAVQKANWANGIESIFADPDKWTAERRLLREMRKVVQKAYPRRDLDAWSDEEIKVEYWEIPLEDYEDGVLVLTEIEFEIEVPS